MEKKHFTVRSEVDILMCLFVLTSKCCSICPFSPGIEEHAGNDEMPSFEGSTVALYFAPCCMSCNALSMSCTLIVSFCVHIANKPVLCSVLTLELGFKC